MSWAYCKSKWSNSKEGLEIKKLSEKDLWEIPQLREICDKFRRGYYTDEQFKAILKNEIIQLRDANELESINSCT